ncbi:MAG: hypothetical protein ACE1ZF_02130 [Gemmatimonadales bacterium]
MSGHLRISRAIAICYDMLTPSFLGMLSLANAMHWLLYAHNS